MSVYLQTSPRVESRKGCPNSEVSLQIKNWGGAGFEMATSGGIWRTAPAGFSIPGSDAALQRHSGTVPTGPSG